MSNLKSGHKPDRTSKDDFSAAALFSGKSGGAKSNPHNITCTFCKQDHTSSKCNMIAGVNSQKAILKSKGKFLLALNKEDGVLLQTATAIVFNRENSNKKKNVRILFNKGSQKSFINQSLRDELNFKTQRRENKILKPFERKNEKMRKLDIVNVCITDTKIQNLTDVELTVVPHICSPISGQTIELAQVMHEHLIDLPLADSTNRNSELAIDILIGGVFYWKFFSGMLRRGLRGPVAEETSLGWVLSGCVGSLLGSSGFVSTYILKLRSITQ